MPRGKHFDAVKKLKIMAWHFEKVPAKEIAARLNRDLSPVHRIIRQNKDLPITTMPGSTPTCRRTSFGNIFSVIHLKWPNNSSWRSLGRLTSTSGRSRKFVIRGWDCRRNQPLKSLFSQRK
jgi:hypothetical protein